MSERVTVGLPTDFPADSVVDLLLDPLHAEEWLGPGGRIEGTSGGTVVVPSALPAPPGRKGAAGTADLPATATATATVYRVTRSRSSFTLKARWDNRPDDAELTLRVTTRPGGASRVRICESGVAPDQVTDRVRLWSKVLDDLRQLTALASAQRRRYRQALVVVHGIGEQRPNATLRSFVEAVFPDARRTTRFVKPDYLSPLMGANSVTVPGRWTMNRPTTDVYELYWAHLIRDTTVGEVYSWVCRLVLAPLANISPKLRPHVVVLRTLVSVVALALVALGVAFVVGEGARTWVTALVTGAAATLALIPAVVSKGARLFGVPVHNLIVADILGDAARYFDTSASNVQARQSVREAGLQLLTELHDRGRYSRIIVYGHSLGSVIAYDILAHCWTRRSRMHENAPSMPTPGLRAVESLLNPRDDAETPTISTVRHRQHAAWNEFVNNGFAWRVSDLVTAGSPLTHARWLLNPDKHTPFDRLVADRSMPTCPPMTTWSRGPRPGVGRRTFTFTHSYRAEGDPRARSVLVPDHGALFALVRWSNLFFPHTRVMSGDPVGGPLQPVFGAWVDDIALPKPAGGLAGFAHTKYVDPSAGRAHIDLLRKALELSAPSDLAFWLDHHEGRDGT